MNWQQFKEADRIECVKDAVSSLRDARTSLVETLTSIDEALESINEDVFFTVDIQVEFVKLSLAREKESLESIICQLEDHLDT